ncbi:MAG: hypothetical protein ACJ0HV_01370 [Candidatus Pseudothioglobus sp.]
MEEPESPTDDDLKRPYMMKMLSSIPTPERRRAQHILLDNEDLANDLLDQINQEAQILLILRVQIQRIPPQMKRAVILAFLKESSWEQSLMKLRLP